MATFFFIFAKKKINNKIRKKKKNAASLATGFKKGHPLDRKQKFFLVWPYCLLLFAIKVVGHIANILMCTGPIAHQFPSADMFIRLLFIRDGSWNFHTQKIKGGGCVQSQNSRKSFILTKSKFSPK